MHISRFAIVILLLTLVTCGPDKYEMEQTIEMGPFVFEVINASAILDFFTSGEQYKKIYVDLLLHTDKSTPTKVSFDDFLNGEAKGQRMIVFPAMKIVDDQGKKFDGIVNRVWEKTRWRAQFYLIDHWRGIQSGANYLDRQARDFQLVIKNPDPRKAQPRRIIIKLQ